MPKFEKKVKKICFHCKFYEVDILGPICNLRGKPFPDAKLWARMPHKKKPGDRTCAEWKGK